MWSQFLLVLLVSACSLAVKDPLIINTKKGKIKGKSVKSAVGKDVDAWLSIPYAQPPVGNLRYRHPRPIDQWQGVKDTTAPPNSCHQLYDDFFGDFEGAMMWNANTPLSEDCLYLSVFVPKPRPKNAAVMVWIYGGGFFAGTSTLDIYDYKTVAATQNIIVAAMNYRVANLGFLYLGTHDTPGNSGLYDQQMALEWIRDNIEQFGGNPDNITLMGESAGAASVSMHLLSPLSRNLFSQAIMQSGSATAPWAIDTKQTALMRAEKLAESVSCPVNNVNKDAMIECLRGKDPALLIKKEVSEIFSDFAFVPIIDGTFFDEMPIDYLKKGDFKKTNILMGSNTEEGYYFLMYFFPNLLPREEKKLEVKRENFTQAVRQLFPCYDDLIHKAIMYEYTDWLDPLDGIKNRDALDKLAGDVTFTCNVNEFAEFYAKSNLDVYMYYFAHRSSGNKWPKWTGVLHADEINFVFGQPFNASFPEYSPAEKNLSMDMMTYWANFAKTGNPNTADGKVFTKKKWPTWDASSKEYLILDTKDSGVGTGPRLKKCAFWKSFLPSLIQTSDTRPQSDNDACVQPMADSDQLRGNTAPTLHLSSLVTAGSLFVRLLIR